MDPEAQPADLYHLTCVYKPGFKLMCNFLIQRKPCTQRFLLPDIMNWKPHHDHKSLDFSIENGAFTPRIHGTCASGCPLEVVLPPDDFPRTER